MEDHWPMYEELTVLGGRAGCGWELIRERGETKMSLGVWAPATRQVTPSWLRRGEGERKLINTLDSLLDILSLRWPLDISWGCRVARWWAYKLKIHRAGKTETSECRWCFRPLHLKPTAYWIKVPDVDMIGWSWKWTNISPVKCEMCSTNHIFPKINAEKKRPTFDSLQNLSYYGNTLPSFFLSSHTHTHTHLV